MEKNEQEIRELIADQQRAVCRKDLDAIAAHYADDAAIFNVKPPYSIQERKQWRGVWESSLAHFPDSFGTEMRDLAIATSGAVATAHFLLRFTGLPGGQAWIRVTIVCREKAGTWKIVHEHSSVPFDPHTGKAALEE